MRKNMTAVSCNSAVAKEEQGNEKKNDDSPFAERKGGLERFGRLSDIGSVRYRNGLNITILFKTISE